MNSSFLKSGHTPTLFAAFLYFDLRTAQSDIYATGASLYHLLTRKYPYGEVEPLAPAFFRPGAAYALPAGYSAMAGECVAAGGGTR